MKRQVALRLARARFASGWRPAKLLSKENAKLRKGWRKALGLSLAPANTSGYEICASRSPECTKFCLFEAGLGAPHLHSKVAACNPTWVSRIIKTLWFFEDRQSFLEKLYREVANNRDAAIRLNVFSDWQWERQRITVSPELAARYGTKSGTFNNIMEVFPETKFYDYTKHYKRMFRSRPDNYHLTFSMSEQNHAQAMNVVGAGMNVAVVVARKADTFNGYPMIDGDQHDLRFLDPEGVFVGLSPKGQLKKQRRSEFVHDPIEILQAA